MDNTQNSLDETASVGTAGSHLKNIKSFSSTAGRLSGISAGPLGAAFCLVFANRRELKKVLLMIITLLMIPVLFIVMLPGLIFGNLAENTGALNSNTLINENILEANRVVTEVLMESHDDVLNEIHAAIARLPKGDTVSINDSYSYGIFINTNQIIAQFCASKDNYREINLAELKRVVRKNKHKLFSYNVHTETVTMEVPA